MLCTKERAYRKMKNREVQWWLMGFLELCDKPLDQKKLTIIKNHLNLVRAVEGELDELNTAIEDRIKEIKENDFPITVISNFQQQLRNSLIYTLRRHVR